MSGVQSMIETYHGADFFPHERLDQCHTFVDERWNIYDVDLFQTNRMRFL